MGKVLGVVACAATVAVDGMAGILGIQAEISQNKVSEMRVWNRRCRAAREEAYELGLTAAALLALAHITTSLLGGCICIALADHLDKSPSHRRFSFASLILSWITVAAGFPMLLIGTLENLKSRSCRSSQYHNFLFYGGMLCFLHGLFCAGCYLAATVGVPKKEKPAHNYHDHAPINP
ncbi:protein VASCULATURE COMPLEXITY AND CONNECTIVITY-like [Malania oleifera]|uniref:protein VASCULATURE COMPLEXITY AND CONNECTIVITY-like n=1 Tax=Malania oleifera TaxID=397392 RepID=UPI0025ADE5D5|nr:protein VASCULATURE COMPLEXITY AND CONNECTIVITY-like [Malania oleifera]